MTPLFKFIADPSAIPFLLRGLIKFTPPAELNDPSELIPNVIRDDVVASLDRLRKDGYTQQDIVNLRSQEKLFQKLAPQFQAVAVPETPEEATALIRSLFFDQISILEQRLSKMALEVSSKVGIFCLSRRNDSLPMWAHYARNAAGLVVEFAGLESVFQGDGTGVLAQPMPVRYERDRLSVTFDTQSHHSLFFSKFSDWAYEKEVRVVVPLMDCREERIGDHHLYLREIPRDCIKRLILGWKISSNDRREILAHIQQLHSNVEIVDARIIQGQVNLEAR